MRGTAVIVLVFLGLGLVASAEEVFVRNRPFQGLIAGAGKGVYVELAPLAAMLEMSLTQDAEGWRLTSAEGEPVADSSRVRTQVSGDGRRLVHLEDLATACGGKVTVNPELSLVDFHLAGRPKIPDPTAGLSPNEVVMAYLATYQSEPAVPLSWEKSEWTPELLLRVEGIAARRLQAQLPLLSARQRQERLAEVVGETAAASLDITRFAQREFTSEEASILIVGYLVTQPFHTGRFRPRPASIQGERATVVVPATVIGVETGAPLETELTFQLVRQGEGWKIDSGVTIKL